MFTIFYILASTALYLIAIALYFIIAVTILVCSVGLILISIPFAILWIIPKSTYDVYFKRNVKVKVKEILHG